MPNIGKWNYFSPEKLEKLQKKEIQKPNPQVSQHTAPQTPWIIPLPNKSGIELLFLILLYDIISRYLLFLGIFPNRLNMDQLKNQLSNLRSYANYNIIIENQILYQEFPLKLGWALKENQKFGKKGGGKRISKHIVVLLEGNF